MPNSAGPNTKGEENLVFGYDLGDSKNSFPGVPAVNCAPVPTSKGSWSVTEITDGSIPPPRKGARVFKFVAGSTSNLFRHSGYYGGGGFSNYNNINPLILGRTSPSNFTTVSEPNKYRWGFWVRGVEVNNAGWSFYIDIGDRGGVSYTVGNKTDWYFISCDNATGTNYNAYPYDFFDIFSSNQGLTMYVADMGIMRAPGTVDSLPIMQAYPQWVDYGQERTYTQGLLDLKGDAAIDLSNVSFDSDAQMTFDGTDDRIIFPPGSFPTIGTNDFTIELVCLNTRTDRYNHFFSVQDQYHFAFKSYNVDGLLYVYRTSQLSTSSAISAYIPSRTDYYHLVCQRIGDNIEIFINGESQGTKSGWGSISIDNNLYNSYIGWGAGTEYTGGDIPIFKMYNRALAANEVQANYNAVKSRFNI